MNSAPTRRQADKLCADIRRQLAYLNKLAARMQALRWPLDDQCDGTPVSTAPTPP